ncbi:MAG TPA: hypothetical protein DCY88_04330 [Cyanobacteria bacterium UBA11372]|nr:hypothetical protein [Cyanobacteria bacterium UBA11372]
MPENCCLQCGLPVGAGLTNQSREPRDMQVKPALIGAGLTNQSTEPRDMQVKPAPTCISRETRA